MSAAALRAGDAAVDSLSQRTGHSRAAIMNEVRMIGGAMIGIAVLVVVLNEIFALDTISTILADPQNETFGGVLTSLENTGAAALGLVVIGLLVLAANRVMTFFGGGGF
jgi:hypothetical protein